MPLRTQNYGNYGIVLTMGNAGFILSAVGSLVEIVLRLSDIHVLQDTSKMLVSKYWRIEHGSSIGAGGSGSGPTRIPLQVCDLQRRLLPHHCSLHAQATIMLALLEARRCL